MTRRAATGLGFLAVLLWALLALLTVGSAPIPPLQLNALCFAIGGLVGLGWATATGRLGVLRHVSWRVYAFGSLGLFGYHLLYFSALRTAPPAEAGLIAYLWPLLIVLFSSLLPGERLHPGHIVGGVLGFAGAAVLVLPELRGFSSGALTGYILAVWAAFTWAGYSVISRGLAHIPTESVAVFCLVTALVSWAAHLAVETTVWTAPASTWAAVLGLGLGPVGLAFFVWDIGVKRGDIQFLGAASYAAPVLSTAALILAGLAPATWRLLLATVLITLGAVVAARASSARSGA